MKNNVPKSLKLKLSIKKNVVNNFVFFLNLKKVKNYSDTKKRCMNITLKLDKYEIYVT